VVIGQAGFKCVHHLRRQADCPQCRAAAEGRDAGVCDAALFIRLADICILFVWQIFAKYSRDEYLTNIRETHKLHLFVSQIIRMLHLIATPDQMGQLLAASRRHAGLTQAEAAARLGISQSRISALETDAGALTLAQLLALCGIYGLQLQLHDKSQPVPEQAPIVEW
jgi:HTH-type transcriptional regulator/antitoxin HipB